MSKTYYVYGHFKPCSDVPFYIGKGLLKRTRWYKRNKHHDAIVKKYGFVVQIFAEVDNEDLAYEIECAFISHAIQEGIKLTNMTPGGEGVGGEASRRGGKKCRDKGVGMFSAGVREKTYQQHLS